MVFNTKNYDNTIDSLKYLCYNSVEKLYKENAAVSVEPRTDLVGRKVIYTDIDKITANNVVTVLKSALEIHGINQGCIDYLYQYNNGIQPILSRVKETRPEINNKIVVNRANEITSFKVGYLLGEPLQYVSRSSDDSNITDKITKLNEYMYAEDKASKDKELADWFTICGTSYRMILPTNDGSLDSPFHIYTLDPRQAFVVYHNGLGNKPVMGVKFVKRSDDTVVYSVYTDTDYYEIVDDKIVHSEPHILHAIPIVEYPANAARLGAFEIVVPLLDAYNLTVSDRLNGLEQFIQSLIKFVNVDITTEQFEQLKDLGGIKFKSTSDNPADVAYLTPELNQANTQTILDDMYQTILTICGMPNRNGGSSTSDTGSAVIMRDGWEVAEAKAKDTELMFKRSEKAFLRIALNIAEAMVGLDLKVAQVDVRFTRRNYENIANKLTVLTTMLACDKIHPKLGFQISGLFADPEIAYSMSEEYYKEQSALEEKRQTQQGGVGNESAEK